MSKIKSAAYPYLQKLRFAKLIALFNNESKKPVEKNTILMLSTSKGKLGGNLLAIKSCIENNSLNYTVTVVTSLNMPPIRELAHALATAEYVLVDDYEPMVYVLGFRPTQHLVQVWHALGAFKKFGYARASAEKNSLTHKNYTQAIVSSPELVPLYAESFGISEEKVIPVGAPRTDVFFDAAYKEAAKKRLFAAEPQIKDKKTVLFAPTFRGSNVNDGYYPPEYLDIAGWMQALEEDWVLIIKLHPFIKNKPEIPPALKNRVFDFSEEREINDLLLITDVLVTDYSSVIYENAVIGGACVHYVPDLDEYTAQRGFYFDYSAYECGAVVTAKEALPKAILEARKDDVKMTEFKHRFVSLCDGNSSKRFVETILED